MGLPVRNEAVVELEADELVQLFAGQPSLYVIDNSRLPADTRVLRADYDPMRHMIRLVVASEKGRFYDIPRGAVPSVVNGVCDISNLDTVDDAMLEAMVVDQQIGPQLLRIARRILSLVLDRAF